VTHDRPTPAELLEAVREFLADEILPILDDHRLKFRTLVAMNGLGIAQRQLEATEDTGLYESELAELARRIRAGDVPDDALPRLRAHVEAKLRISSPSYLERYD
jgi:Domain of unknown function (DUF6285)